MDTEQRRLRPQREQAHDLKGKVAAEGSFTKVTESIKELKKKKCYNN